MDLSNPDVLIQGLIRFAALLFSLGFHEFGHAWVALRCGDPTAKLAGRVTLNPRAHADPIGTVLFPLVQIFSNVPLIGWAKPVPVDRSKLTHPAFDSVLVALAGPGFNLLLAALAALVLRFAGASVDGIGWGWRVHDGYVIQFLVALLQINILLALFNLIPVPPLDGSYVVEYLLPRPFAAVFRNVGNRFGFMLVLALVYTGITTRFIGAGFNLVRPFFAAIVGP